VTDFQVLEVHPQADGSTRLRFSVILEPTEWVATDSAILWSMAHWGAEFELQGQVQLPRTTPPGGQIPFYEVPATPTRREVEAVARFQPVNEESSLAAFKKALQRT